MNCPPSLTRSYRYFKRVRVLVRALARARARARSGKPSCACKLFSVRPYPKPEGLINNGYIYEYNKPTGIARALEKRILNSQISHKN